MKTRMLVIILILVLLVLIVAGSCATGKKAITIEDPIKNINGVYVNTDYGERAYQPQKIVITFDGRFEDWELATQETASGNGEYTIAKSWVDSKGNMYGTVVVKYHGSSTVEELWKLDKTGNTLEMNFRYGSGDDYPTKIDPDVEHNGPLFYCIYYRQ
jgi:hypothetical protein